MSRLGSLVKQRRNQLHLTQAELANMVGVDGSYIGLIETGRRESPAKEILINMARALEVPIEDLLAAAGYPVGKSEPERPRRTIEEVMRELQEVTPIMVPETTQPASAGAGNCQGKLDS